MAFCLVDLNKSFTFASDDESQKRLVARHRVFFDANYSRTRRLERSLIRNPQNPKSPELPLYKEILRILTKLRKNVRNEKEKDIFLFHFRVPVTSAESKLRKIDKNAKGKPAFLSFKKKMYLCTILNMMIMPNKNIFVGFGLRSEFVSLISLLDLGYAQSSSV